MTKTKAKITIYDNFWYIRMYANEDFVGSYLSNEGSVKEYLEEGYTQIQIGHDCQIWVNEIEYDRKPGHISKFGSQKAQVEKPQM